MKPNESTRTNDSNPGSLPSKLSKKTSSAIRHFFQCIRSFADVFHTTCLHFPVMSVSFEFYLFVCCLVQFKRIPELYVARCIWVYR